VGVYIRRAELSNCSWRGSQQAISDSPTPLASFIQHLPNLDGIMAQVVGGADRDGAQLLRDIHLHSPSREVGLMWIMNRDEPPQPSLLPPEMSLTTLSIRFFGSDRNRTSNHSFFAALLRRCAPTLESLFLYSPPKDTRRIKLSSPGHLPPSFPCLHNLAFLGVKVSLELMQSLSRSPIRRLVFSPEDWTAVQKEFHTCLPWPSLEDL